MDEAMWLDDVVSELVNDIVEDAAIWYETTDSLGDNPPEDGEYVCPYSTYEGVRKDIASWFRGTSPVEDDEDVFRIATVFIATEKEFVPLAGHGDKFATDHVHLLDEDGTTVIERRASGEHEGALYVRGGYELVLVEDMDPFGNTYAVKRL